MSYTIKIRGAVGQPIMAEYLCSECGIFETVLSGPPDETDCITCGATSALLDAAPKPKNLTVLPTAVVKGGDTDRRPGMLDTRPLAEGQSYADWRKVQDKARESRRHDMLVSKGLKQKRIQVG